MDGKAKIGLASLTTLTLLAFGLTPVQATDACDPLSPSWVYTPECDVEITQSYWSSNFVDVGQADGRIDYGFMVNAPSGLSEFSYLCGEADPVRIDSPGTVFGISLTNGELSARTAFVRINNRTTTFPIQAVGNNKNFSISGSLVIPKGTNPFEGSCTFSYAGGLTLSQNPSGGDTSVGSFSLTRSTIQDSTPPRIDWEFDTYSVNTATQDARLGFSFTATDNVSLLAAEILCQESGYVQRNGFSDYSEDTGNFDYSGFEVFALDDVALSIRFKGTRGTPFSTGNLFSSADFSDRGKRTSGTVAVSGDANSATLRGSIPIPRGTPTAKLVCIGLTGDAYSNVTLGISRDFSISNPSVPPVTSATSAPGSSNTRPLSRTSRATQELRSAESNLRSSSSPGSIASSGRPNLSNTSLPITTSSGQLPQMSTGSSVMLIDGVENSLRVQQINDRNFRASTADGLTLDIENSGSNPNSSGPLLTKGKSTRFSGSGFAPNTKVVIWLFSEPTKIGEMDTDEAGNVDSAFVIPGELEAGEHTLQISGQHPDGSTRALVIGVELEGETLMGSQVQSLWAVGLFLFIGMLVAFFAVVRRKELFLSLFSSNK